MLNFGKPARVITIFAFILVAVLGLSLAFNRDLREPGGRSEINQATPELTITTPRDLYSPFMSSIFGFELVVQGAPANTTMFNYVSDKGSFWTYHNGQVKDRGDNVTTAETIYWTGFSGVNQQFITQDGNILITVTALDKGGRALASGSALVECGNDGKWFKFLGGPADPCSAETSGMDSNSLE